MIIKNDLILMWKTLKKVVRGEAIDLRKINKDHCDYMLKKIRKKSFSFLNRIGSFVSPYTRCIVYKSIIAPHFEYCATLN